MLRVAALLTWLKSEDELAESEIGNVHTRLTVGLPSPSTNCNGPDAPSSKDLGAYGDGWHRMLECKTLHDIRYLHAVRPLVTTSRVQSLVLYYNCPIELA